MTRRTGGYLTLTSRLLADWRAPLRAILHRFAPTEFDWPLIAASAGLGVLVGLAVGVVEIVTVEVVLHHTLELPIYLLAAAPMFGLGITHLLLSTIGGGASSATSEEYVTQYHNRRPHYVVRHMPARLLAGVSTIGLGGAVGLEGPSIYLGSGFGYWLHRSLERYLGKGSVQLLLTAGAAAGVSAVFQAPATGVVFALESPYRDDVAHRALLPSLVASATSFLAFATVPFVPHGMALQGANDPLLGTPGFVGTGELIGALALGVGAGLGGRTFAWLIRHAKRLAKEIPTVVEIIGGGAVLGVLVLVSYSLFDEPLTYGPGTEVFSWLDHTESSLSLVAVLFAMRALATLTTVGAGGVGGLFIPLAVQGVLLGHLVGDGLESLGLSAASNGRIWEILGLAAFLAAGYRTPIAAVMFVAESTRGSAVIPALIAAAVSQLVAGRSSVSAAQRAERLGGLESRLAMPISAALSTNVLTVPHDATVSDFVWFHALGQRTPVVPVVNGNRFLGMCNIHDAAEVDREEWDQRTVADIVDANVTTGETGWSIRDAVAAMGRDRSDLLVVVDDSGGFVGTVSESEIVKLHEILAETDPNDNG